MTRTVCACGLDKVFTPQLIARCNHCDVPCRDRAYCHRCATFNTETRKRTEAEYKAEKRG